MNGNIQHQHPLLSQQQPVTSSSLQQQPSLNKEQLEQMNTIKRELRGLPHLELIEKIGSGSFGDIFKVWDSKRGRWAAMKFEKKDKKSKYSLIKKEAQIMQQVKGSRYFAMLFDSRFTEISTYNFIEMSYLGSNMESLKKRLSGGKFSLRTVLLIAKQMISGLQVLHEKGIIHRDIKPENFVIGPEGQHHQVYVIDFGLSKYYLEENGTHIEQKQNKGLVGTARYTSVNSHQGLEQSRRDDLESLAYLLLYFAKGTLVWQNLNVKDKDERFRKIAELKQTTSPEVMCRGLPKQFLEFLTLVKALGFTQKPEYDRYRALFSACYIQHFTSPENQVCYDWCPKSCQLAALQRVVLNGSSSEIGVSRGQTFKNLGEESKIKSSQKIQQNASASNMPEFKSITLMSTDKKDNIRNSTGSMKLAKLEQSQLQQPKAIARMPLTAVPVPRKNKGIDMTLEMQKQKSHDLFDLLNVQVTPFKPNWEESPREDKDRSDESSMGDFPCSEFQNGELKANDVPAFRTENNDLKEQSIRQMSTSLGQFHLVTSGNLGVVEGRVKPLMLSNYAHSAQNIRLPESLILQQQQQQLQGTLMTSRQLLNGEPLSSTYQFANKDNSRYVNECSNEWNSDQDEKVEVKLLVPFSSVNLLSTQID